MSEELAATADRRNFGRIKSFDILTYRSADGEIKVNPFAYGIYLYECDIYNKLKDRIKKALYFHRLLKETDNGLTYTDADIVRAKARNKSAVKNFDIAAAFGFADDEIEKVIATAELKEVVDSARLTDRNGRKCGKAAFIKEVNELERYTIESLGRKQINGKRAYYYRVAKIVR